MKLLNLWYDFINLFYPLYCASCDTILLKGEKVLCLTCLSELPKTNFHRDPENEVAQMFWGRVPVEHATAYYHFHKGGHVQKILHKLKYKNQKEIGLTLGEMIGKELQLSSFSQVEVIIPVPLHKSKLRKRGYNQSELIANGLSIGMNRPIESQVLFRAIANPTQTKKHRFERWVNVEGIFAVKNAERIANKHVLLVDDVITTGATLEACLLALLTAENVKVSVFTLAKA